jgi:hypothetical protein
VVGDEELVARLESERAQHGVHAGGGVRHEREAGGVGPEALGKRAARFVQGAFELAEEAHRIRFHAAAPARLRREHLARAGAVGTVVEVDDVGVEDPGTGSVHEAF